jgi:hypothetical protein
MYKQTAKALGATHLLWVQGPHAIPEVADQEISRHIYSSIVDIRAAYPSATFVFLDTEGTSIKNYVHPPEDVIYVVGEDTQGLSNLQPQEGEDIIRISSSIELWSHVAAGIVLYDRKIKQ